MRRKRNQLKKKLRAESFGETHKNESSGRKITKYDRRLGKAK